MITIQMKNVQRLNKRKETNNMSEEIRTVLNDVEQKLYTMGHIIRDEFTEEEKKNIRKAWYLVYGVLNNRF